MIRSLLRTCAAAVVLLPVVSGAQARGKATYDKWCASCHGDTGAGDGAGAAYMLPRPRDFTKAVYQIRTTASGELPTDDDLRQVIANGMPGTAMPEWASVLDEKEREDVLAYLKTFSDFFKGKAPTAISFGSPPGGADSEESLKEGAAVYRKLECFKCHGDAGRGDGPSAPKLEDDWKHPIRAADLTENWSFNGGGEVEAIYARLRTGLDGTPMPSISDALDQKLVTDEQLWKLAHYIRSLSPETAPVAREVVRIAQVEGALPTGPDDKAWEAIERFWIPLVGQIILKPRWFAPTAEGIWIQGVHDGKRVVVRFSWDDPSRSPDPVWDPWTGRIAQSMMSADGANATTQGADRLLVFFPQKVTSDAELPYFLGGSARRPAYGWRWTSAGSSVEEGTSRGLGSFTAAGATGMTQAAVFDKGQWRLQLSRALVPTDTTNSPVFRVGEAIPMALFAADGSNGEDDKRGSVSAWYALYLDVPTPARVYVAPVVTMVLAAGAGMLAIAQAQRRERSSEN